jgi:hypothetical protein
MDSLKYEPLDSERKEIRLIEILSPGTKTLPSECRLSTISLLESPSFAALSYVWGDSSVTENIILDGYTVPVTKNLAAALKHVKHHWQQQYPAREPSSFRIWVDAICINQKDIPERNWQVRLMQFIYSQAEIVLAWLGAGDMEMSLALRTFNIIAQEVKTMDEDDISLQWMEQYPSLCAEDRDSTRDGIGNKAWTGMWNFFLLPYWYRMWVYQELALAKNLLLMYGFESLQFEDLETVCEWSMRIQEQGPRRLYQLSRPQTMSDAAWSGVTGPYIHWFIIHTVSVGKQKDPNPGPRWGLLFLCRDLRATDPKDQIYGLLGILEEGLEAKIIPDYKKTVGEVYCDTIGLWIQEKQNLQFLSLAGIGRFHYDLELPSWVPNFPKVSETPGSSYIMLGHADRGVFESDIDKIIVAQSTLQAIGVEVDQITRVEEAPKFDTWRDGRMLQYCIDFVSRNSVYVTGVPPLQAIFRVLMQFEDSEEDQHHQCLLALGFLRYIIHFSKFDGDVQARYSLLGLSIGDKFPESFEEKVFPGCDYLKSGFPNLSTVSVNEEGSLSNATTHVLRAAIHYRHMFCFIETPGGYLGLAPHGAKIGDIVCVLKACNIPVILRKVNEHYVHIGTCYMLGLMEGETAGMLESGHRKVQRFQIQ